jgi:feruloyl esterase
VGPSTFDPVQAVVDWVENDIAPDIIVATQYNGDEPSLGVNRTRPYCVWPRKPLYNGSGSINDYTSFNCTFIRP